MTATPTTPTPMPTPAPPNAPTSMTPTRQRRRGVQTAALAVTAIGNALVGLWAVITPRGFYDNFPGAGHHWVSMDGPYDQHLVFDVGLLSLALTVTILAALWKREKVLVATASIAALIFAVPHLAFHASHLDHFSTTDSILEMASLAITVAAPLVSLWTVARRATTDAPREQETATRH